MRVALGYFIVGMLWISFSDTVVERHIRGGPLALWVSIGKGYAFVLLTAALLYLAVRTLNTRQHATQLRLARSESAYRAMFESNPNPMFVCERETLRLLEINRAAVAAYGWPHSEFLDLTVRDLYPPHVASPLGTSPLGVDLQSRLQRSDFVVLSPVVHRVRGGGWIEVELTVSLLDMGGQPAYLLMAQDISQRLRGERELLESRRQLEEAQRIAGLGAWSIDETGVLRLSAQTAGLLAAADETRPWTLQTLVDYVHPDDRAALQRAIENAWRGQRLQLELRLLRPGGEHRQVLLRGELAARGDLQQLTGTLLDIDQRKRSEKQLQDSERQYRQLIDNLADAVLIYRNNKVIFVNPAAARLFGAERPGQLLGSDIDDYIAEPSKDEARQRLRWLQGGSDRTDARFRERLLRKLDGEVFTAEVAARSTLLNGEHCIQAMVRDISEQKRNQQELRLANERLLHVSTQMLEAAESERRHLARELHDDLGQSLTFIKMTAAWLRKRFEHEPGGERIAQVQETAGEALEKIRHLALTLRPAQLDAKGLKAAMDEHLHKFCDGGGIGWQLRAEELQPRPDPEVEIALFRIFQEALNNIFRHSGASFVQVELIRRQQRIELRVIDDGGGFDVDEALVRGGHLGLHTMQERARQLGGGVQWHSVIGAGTAVSASIPERAT